MRADGPTHAVVVLLEDAAAAAAVAGVIEDVVHPGMVTALVAPVRGMAFFADAAVAAELDRWWRESVPRDALPIYVIDFAPDVVPWLDGIDGVVLMCDASRSPDEMLEPGMAEMEGRVRVIQARSPLEVAARALHLLADEGVCHPQEANGLLAFAAATSGAATEPEPRGAGPLADAVPPPGVGVASLLGADASPPARDDVQAPRRDAVPPAAVTGAPAPPAAHPFDLLAAMPPPPQMPAAASHQADGQSSNGRRRSIAGLLRRPAWHGLRPPSSEPYAGDVELARSLARRGSTLVAIGSRKGGVGKTSHAAGMAIVAGHILDAIGHRAVIVDANVANPDAWGVLNLPPGAATVRDTVAALEANLDPPRPVHATTPALACYPEARETTEYSRYDIQLLARHLRRGFTLAVVDLSNRLPDPTGGPEAAAAAYWLDLADVVVLPTAWSKQDFNGVLDYLELPDLPPAVVAYISPRARRHREHPLTQQYLDAIAQRACRIVELPDEADNVRFAGMAGIPLDSVSRRLRMAYRALTEAVVGAAAPADA